MPRRPGEVGFPQMLYSKIVVPKFIIIENKRLGLLLRVLQMCAAAFAVWLILVSRTYLKPYAITPYGGSYNTMEGDATKMADSTVTHCTLGDAYAGNTAFPKPDACRWLPTYEATTLLADGAFFATAVEDEYVQEKRADCAALQAACTGTYVDRGGGQCSCTEKTDFFTQNPEERKFAFHHGYEVALDSSGKIIQRGTTSIPKAKRVESTAETIDVVDKDEPMVTKITKADGTPCKIGASSDFPDGLSTWTAAEAQENGIVGTMKEWLACAGVDLDEDADVAVTTTENVKLRRTGMVLNLEVSTDRDIGDPMNDGTQHNFGDGDTLAVIATVRVSAKMDSSNSVTSLAYTNMYRADTGEGNYRARQAFGVTVRVTNKGQFLIFDEIQTVTSLVNSLVVLGLPNQFVMGIALYCIGLLSKIYYAAQSQRLNITAQFHGACARYMMAAQGFRGLTGQNKIDHGMTFAELTKHMKIVFNKELSENGGEVESDELMKMTRMVMWGMDRPDPTKEAAKDEAGLMMQIEDGDINCDEFIRAAGCNEVIRMSQIAKFFDDDRKPSIMERLFDDTDRDAPPAEEPEEGGFVEKFDVLTL
jgi:hypothetical protein